MNKEIEETIVKSFFVKRIQQRILFELSSPQKRSNALGRLNILRKEFMFQIPKPNSDPGEIEKLLKKEGAGDICYVIQSGFDGKELLLKEALEDLIWYRGQFIISCIPGKLAYFQDEHSIGPPQRFILKKQ